MSTGACPIPEGMKFHGKFRELVPTGYTFSYMFARNYRCYFKNTKYTDHIWIWQHHGGYVEINDFYQHSSLVLQAVLNGHAMPFVIDKQEKRAVFGDPFLIFEKDRFELRDRLADGQDCEAFVRYRDHCERYRRVHLEDETVAEIRAAGERGWLKTMILTPDEYVTHCESAASNPQE